MYSRETKRQAIIDWRYSVYTNSSDNLFEYLFGDCVIKNILLKGKDIDKIKYPEPFYPSFYNNINIHSPPELNSEKIYKDQRQKEIDAQKIRNLHHFSENTIIMNESVRIFPYWEKPNDKVKEFINIIWKLLPEDILSHMQKTYSEIFANKEKIIGVHLRFGNRDKGFDFFLKKRSKSYCGQSIKEYIQQQIIPIIQPFFNTHYIYIATDTEEAINISKELIPNCIIYNKWFAEPGYELHFSAVYNQISNGLEILKDALTEIFLLSHCEKIFAIYKNSAFTNIAGMLNRCPSVVFV